MTLTLTLDPHPNPTPNPNQVMSADERAMDEMKTEAKRAFAKKQRQQMEARKPEASLMLMRRDEQTGQLRLAGFEAASML